MNASRPLRPDACRRAVALLKSIVALALLAWPAGAIGAETNDTPATAKSPTATEPRDIFSKENLVAWCIVPFDAKKRGPEERAEMLKRLGIRRLAYDYRAEHVPTFDAEVQAMRKHAIDFTAWWFPSALNEEAKLILSVIERHGIRPQLWVMGSGGNPKDEAEQKALVEREAARIRPIAAAAQALGCQVALYNHGGWFGQPANQVQIIDLLKNDGVQNVGIVYNFHHGHEHIGRFAEIWKVMQPHLLTVNLNGMVRDGDKRGKKILNLGDGDQEAGMLRVIKDSGWKGPVGIIDHRVELDSEVALSGNLQGLEKLRAQLKAGK